MRADLLGEDRLGKRLSVASAMWADESLALAPDFVRSADKHHKASVRRLDFRHQPERARRAINGWAAEHTRDKIRQLLSERDIDSSLRLVLTGTTYFKAPWASAFSPNGTREAEFFSGKASKKVPMMSLTKRLPYLEDKDLQAVQLPFEDRQAGVLVLLPAKGKELSALEGSLTGARLREICSRLDGYDVEVAFPKFKVAGDYQLQDTLRAMGMGAPFSGSADYSGITTTEKVGLHKVIHKTTLEVDEKGSEAAAATAILMPVPVSARLAPPPPPKSFRADRPFVFVLRDTKTGTVLFIGRFSRPQ